MNAARLSKTISALVFIYLFQITVIARIDFPFGSFDLFLLCALVFIARSDRIGAISIGFIAGFLLDLTPGLDSPIGQWMLIMTLMGWVISLNRESVGNFEDSTLVFVLIISAAIAISLIAYLILSWLLGENTGQVFNNLKSIFIETLWSLFLSPLLMPLILKFNNQIQSNQERV
jgi:rod shape-determining protein MreD